MTLCLAWRHDGDIHFASDSRISFGGGNYVDVGVKVLSLPVKIYHPLELDKEYVPTYTFTLGICYAGDVISIYNVNESLREVLQNLQFDPRHANISMNSICNIISFFYENVSRKICEQLREDGISLFMVTGYCLKDKLQKTYKFTLDISDYPIKAKYEEILNKDGEYEVIGSGKSKAEEIIKNNSPDYFKVLQTVIEDKSVSSVGGAIQYGVATNEHHDFETYGLAYTVKDQEGYLDSKLILRGIEVYNGEFSKKFGNIYLAYHFIKPFGEEPIEDKS